MSRRIFISQSEIERRNYSIISLLCTLACIASVYGTLYCIDLKLTSGWLLTCVVSGVISFLVSVLCLVIASK